MPVSLTTPYAVGTVWADGVGEKSIVIAHDFISDCVIVYNYPRKKEFQVRVSQLEDGGGLKRKWDEQVAFEKGVFAGLEDDLTLKVQTAFTDSVRNETGPAMSSFREIVKPASGPNELDEQYNAYEYHQYIIIAPLRVIGRPELIRITADFETLIRTDIQLQKITRIVWRTNPELHVHHEEITGERKIKLYARFCAFSENETIDHKRLAGYRDENRLTHS